MTKGLAPHSLRVSANGRDHHVLAWSDREKVAARTVLLVHGYMDAAGTWDRVVQRLLEAGHRVFAPDMRGFGRGPRVFPGGYYHFADYVADLADLVDALAPDGPVVLVGHSMGGTIATLFAGTFPERVSHVVSIEGLGPPDNLPEIAPTRMRRWIDDVRKLRARGAERPMTRDEAMARLAMNHPNVDRDVLASRLPHLVEAVPEDLEGRVVWTFDPLHRTTSPTPFQTSVFVGYARRITCPVLFVSGGATGFHPPDEDARLAAFASLERLEIGGAGHMVHWTHPDALASALVAFVR